MHVLTVIAQKRVSAFVAWLLTPCLTLLLTGCQKEDIQVYEVPKEPVAPPAASASAHNPHGASGSMRTPVTETVAWEALPEGWEDQGASGVRKANLSFSNDEGQRAEIAVMPFAKMGGSDLDFVNMWRTSLGLEPVEEPSLSQMVQPITIGDVEGKFYDVSDPVPEGGEAPSTRIVVAMLVRGDTSWFFKLAGDTPAVDDQLTAFKGWLQNVSFKEGETADPHAGLAMPSSSSAPATGTEPAKPQWQVPEGWSELPATTMLIAKFRATGDEGAASDITVSVFPGDVGGLLANVNRWRSQVGEPALSPEDLPNHITTLELEGSSATLVDVTGLDNETSQSTRLVGAIIPRGNSTWFYKMLGPADLTGQQKEAFLQFIKSARYPNG